MSKRQWIPAGGLIATVGLAVYAMVQLAAQATPLVGDFTSAAAAEVRDARGQVVLKGAFGEGTKDDEDGDIERAAVLQPTGVDADASGTAEIEFEPGAAASQEIELDIRNIEPGATFTLLIDGREIGTATADKNGRAEIEVDVRASAN